MHNSSIHDILSWSCLSFRCRHPWSHSLITFITNFAILFSYPLVLINNTKKENFVLSNLLTWSFSWITYMKPIITPWAYIVISFSLAWVILWRLSLRVTFPASYSLPIHLCLSTSLLLHLILHLARHWNNIKVILLES